MNTPMHGHGPWPVALNVVMRVRPRSGAEERWRFRLEPGSSAGAVHVGSWEPEGGGVAWQHIDWHGLPGRTLFQVGLGVLAVRLFGAVEPAPRIVGAPLWAEVAAELTPDTTLAPPLAYELHALDDSSALLRVGQRAGHGAVWRPVPLQRVDADPLLALLRLGLCHVKPGALRSGRQTCSPNPGPGERCEAVSDTVLAGH